MRLETRVLVLSTGVSRTHDLQERPVPVSMQVIYGAAIGRYSFTGNGVRNTSAQPGASGAAAQHAERDQIFIFFSSVSLISSFEVGGDITSGLFGLLELDWLRLSRRKRDKSVERREDFRHPDLSECPAHLGSL